MLNFSSDAAVAEQEMQAVIWYLTAIAHLDGHYDESEREYVRDHVSMLVQHRARAAVGDDLAPYADAIAQWVKHFHEVADMVAAEVSGYFTESVGEGEDPMRFVTAKLKLRCFELFQRFDDAGRAQLLRVAEAVIKADGVVHPSEEAFADELSRLLHVPLQLDESALEPIDRGSLVLEAPRSIEVKQEDHPFLRATERAWSQDKESFAVEAEEDLRLIERVIEALDGQRKKGFGKLAGHKEFGGFEAGARFLDGHVYVYQPGDDEEVELLVIGDLHGCYSCLKAALLQADFFTKVQAHHNDPKKHPAMKLVLLGDYIDRGRFSYNGVLRAAMRLFLAAPDDVYVLRGNHEYYVEMNGRVLAPVRPAEAMTSIQSIAPQGVFAAYMKLFEALPNMLAFDRTLFVHAGIPRDDTFAEKFRDLASLNEHDLRFQMLWSDPSSADVVPSDLQAANARFPFGRKQFQRFMGQLGLRALVRGHEKVNEGYRVTYDDPQARLITLFSSGGKTNNDLPPTSSYRDVTPMALTVKHKDGISEVHPFEIDYQRFNDPRFNQFFGE
ncbi:MAG: metallophosphoesterase [Myxococcales bacterium]|nr:metallophosphoesterase [Myxococcales bacterium]